jgi:hypothetical protein
MGMGACGGMGSRPAGGLEIEEIAHRSRDMWWHGSPPRSGKEIEVSAHRSGDTWQHESLSRCRIYDTD